MRTRLVLIFAAFALLAGACSSGSDEGSDSNEVASLEDTGSNLEDAASAATEEPEPELTADEAALEFSACMRESDISFPDLAVGADGNIQMRESMQAADPGRGTPEFTEAIEACGPLLESAGFGGGRRAAIGDNVEIQDALLAVSECVRDAGYDVGDITLGGPGQGPGAGQPPAQGEGDPEGPNPNAEGGNRQGGFGDIGTRLADQLGLDPEDPDVIATMETCTPILTDALTNAGLGGR